MDRALFQDWFHNQLVPKVNAFNKENRLPNCAILLIDNAPPHPEEIHLAAGDITAVFLPPNTTSIVQPMDQGVLQAIKQNYRKMLLRILVEESDEQLTILQKLKKINVKDVIFWVAEAWANTKERALQKSWKNLWPTLAFVDTSFQPDTDCNLLPLVNKLPGCEKEDESCIQEWIDIDDNGHQEYGDDEILAKVQGGKSAENEFEDSDDDDEGNTKDLIPHTDAANALDLALRYVEQQTPFCNAKRCDVHAPMVKHGCLKSFQ